MSVESTIFKQKCLTNFQTLTRQISLLTDFTHFKHPLSLQNSKTTYSVPLSLFPMFLKFQVNLAEVSLIRW